LCFEALVISLLELLDFIIVDIKSINSEIYREYTQMDNEIMLKNLRKIRNIPDVLIRIPIVPEYNDENDVEISKDYLRNLGFEKFDVFRYKTEE
jgi:pyruvate formate lyase activating enzyme